MEKIILTTPVEHIPTCQKSGAQACRDYIHVKEKWNRDDLDLMTRILDNYISKKE